MFICLEVVEVILYSRVGSYSAQPSLDHYLPKRPFSPFKYRLNGKQKSAVLFRP
jgi:hypothetical protein